MVSFPYFITEHTFLQWDALCHRSRPCFYVVIVITTFSQISISIVSIMLSLLCAFSVSICLSPSYFLNNFAMPTDTFTTIFTTLIASEQLNSDKVIAYRASFLHGYMLPYGVANVNRHTSTVGSVANRPMLVAKDLNLPRRE